MPFYNILTENGQVVGMDIRNNLIQMKAVMAMMNKLAELRVAGHEVALQAPGVGRISFDGQAEGLMLVEEVSQCLTLAPAFAQQAKREQNYHRQHEDGTQDGTDEYRILSSGMPYFCSTC